LSDVNGKSDANGRSDGNGKLSKDRSARSLLLTILGEAVAPTGEQVWQEALIEALEALGVTRTAGRQVLARAVRDNWLASERIGRRSLLTLSVPTLALLRNGRARTLTYGAPQQWSGRWLLVTLTVPEERRELRYQVRKRLAWLGFGSLGNGIWISPHEENHAAAVDFLRAGNYPGEAFVFAVERPLSHAPAEIASAAWDLEDLRGRLDDFYLTYSRMEPRQPEEVFASWIAMVNDWRHLPLVDPELPDTLLPRDWPRKLSYELFHRRSDQWLPVAMAYFEQLNPIKEPSPAERVTNIS
jgi:phenylacetic acid degradation operon negative regulatory protein